MTKQQKRFARLILFTFIFGIGGIFGYCAANFTWAHIIIGFFAFVGFCILAVLTYAAIFDDTTEQDDMTYPQPNEWDKSYDN